MFADSDLLFGHPRRRFDETPEYFDHRDDRYESPPVGTPEEGIVHYGPGDRPLCGDDSMTAVYTDDPADCLELVVEDLQDHNDYLGRCLHCRQEITA